MVDVSGTRFEIVLFCFVLFARTATHVPARTYGHALVKANDTDVLVIAISVLPSLQELGLENMWIAFGQGAKCDGFQSMRPVGACR